MVNDIEKLLLSECTFSIDHDVLVNCPAVVATLGLCDDTKNSDDIRAVRSDILVTNDDSLIKWIVDDKTASALVLDVNLALLKDDLVSTNACISVVIIGTTGVVPIWLINGVVVVIILINDT